MTIQEIKSQLSITAVLHYYGINTIKNKQVCCPFHEDKTPSMQVYEDKGLVYCHSSNCPQGGKHLDGIEIFALMDRIDKHKAILKAQEFIGANPLAKPTLPTMTEEINYSELFTKSQQCYIRNDKAQTYTIQKGKPHQNGYIERFNRTFRDEVLNVFVFESLNQARLYTQAWMWVYNNERPHSSFGYLTLTQFLLK